MQFDFRVLKHGTVWTIEAVSQEAKEFVSDHVEIADWMGSSERFTTDWRPARDLVMALDAEGFTISTD